LQACSNTTAPSSARCSLSRMQALLPRRSRASAALRSRKGSARRSKTRLSTLRDETLRPEDSPPPRGRFAASVTPRRFGRGGARSGRRRSAATTLASLLGRLYSVLVLPDRPAAASAAPQNATLPGRPGMGPNTRLIDPFETKIHRASPPFSRSRSFCLRGRPLDCRHVDAEERFVFVALLLVLLAWTRITSRRTLTSKPLLLASA
jgi:hypothetical protein